MKIPNKYDRVAETVPVVKYTRFKRFLRKQLENAKPRSIKHCYDRLTIATRRSLKKSHVITCSTIIKDKQRHKTTVIYFGCQYKSTNEIRINAVASTYIFHWEKYVFVKQIPKFNEFDLSYKIFLLGLIVFWNFKLKFRASFLWVYRITLQSCNLQFFSELITTQLRDFHMVSPQVVFPYLLAFHWHRNHAYYCFSPQIKIHLFPCAIWKDTFCTVQFCWNMSIFTRIK